MRILALRTYPTKIFRRFLGLFWPLFTPIIGAKSSQNNRKNRLKLFSWIGSMSLFIPSLVFSATTVRITLLNDSPFTLTAVVQGADGTFIGQAIFRAGQQSNFVTALSPTNLNSPGIYNKALSPYIVIWKCPSGSYYSVCSQVAPGSLVTANTCPGNHFCQARKKKPDQNKNMPGQTEQQEEGSSEEESEEQPSS